MNTFTLNPTILHLNNGFHLELFFFFLKEKPTFIEFYKELLMGPPEEKTLGR